MKRAIALLEKHNLLKIISDELDINLEIPHIAYVEVKRADSKAILFTNVVDRKNGKKFKEPVLMNVFWCLITERFTSTSVTSASQSL